MVRQTYKKHEFLATTAIDDQFLSLLLQEFKMILQLGADKNVSGLEGFQGRGKITKFNYENCSYILRLFRRGGLVSKLNSNLFLRSFFNTGSFRPYWEFEVLVKLINQGIKVPTPKVAIVKKIVGNLYHGALVTKELIGSKNLLDLITAADRDFNMLIEVSYLAGIETAKTIQAGIYHVDLHPGNVLCLQNTAYLIDFDKARRIPSNIKFEEIANKITSRWDRSLFKNLVKSDDIRVQLSSSFKAGVYYGK